MRNLAITAISSVSLLFGGCATVDLSEVMKNDGVDLSEKEDVRPTVVLSAEEIARRDYTRANIKYFGCVLMNGNSDPSCIRPERPAILDSVPSEEPTPAPTPDLQPIAEAPQTLGFQPAS